MKSTILRVLAKASDWPYMLFLAVIVLGAVCFGYGHRSPKALEQLTINGQSVTTESIHKTDLEEPLYEVRLTTGDAFYSDAKGRRMIVGNLYENTPTGLIDVTEQRSRQHRLDQLKALPRESTINYPAKGREISEVTVFTDTTCAFCQKLHQEIDQLTAAGIAVRYVPFPREGSHSLAGHQLAQVLCSPNPGDALTTVFQGGPLENDPSSDCLAAVENGYQLGQRFGVRGTPSIVLPDGEMGEGYMPVQQLIQVSKRGGL